MDTDPQSPSGASVALEVLARWDETSETVYSLKEATAEVGALGIEYPARAVDPGGVVRDMRVVVLSPLEASNLRGLIHDRIVPLGALRNPIIGAAEATLVVDDGYALVSPVVQGRTLDQLLEGGPIPARAATEVALEVAWGLAASHAAVLPDQIRPMAIPHGRIDAHNVIVSGLGEVVLADYNVHAARSSGSAKHDDIYGLAALFVHLVTGDPLPPPPADADAARQAISEDVDGLTGITDDLRLLIAEMLDPDPARRPEVRSVARRLRQVIPHQDGLWLSAWAESVIGLPARQAPEFIMPTPTLVTEDYTPEEPEEPAAETRAQRAGGGATRRLVKVGRKRRSSVQVRFSAPVLVGGLLAVMLVLGGGFKLARFYIDKHGLYDMFEGLSDGEGGGGGGAQSGPTGPRAPGPTPPKATSDVNPDSEEMVIAATAPRGTEGSDEADDEAGIEAEDQDVERDEAADGEELTELDDLDSKAQEVALEDGEDQAAAEAEEGDSEDEALPAAPDQPEPAVADDVAEAEADAAREPEEEEAGPPAPAAVAAPVDDPAAADPDADGADGDAVAALDVEVPPEVVVPAAPPSADPEPLAGPPPWPRPAGTRGEHDLFVEVPLAESVQLRCTNGLSMRGPSRFRAAIMQSNPTRCVVSAGLRDGSTATVTLQLDRTLDLICRYNFHETLRCSDREKGTEVVLPTPSEQELAPKRFHVRVRVPLALSAEVVCNDGTQDSGVDVEWLEVSQVMVGLCRVSSTMPDGSYTGSFNVTKNSEVLCLRDFSGPLDTDERRPLRCAETTVL